MKFLYAAFLKYYRTYPQSVNAVDTGSLKSTSDPLIVATSLKITSEGIPVLEALMIVVRSVHNCRVLGYHGGIQKLIGLIKGILNCNNELFMRSTMSLL